MTPLSPRALSRSSTGWLGGSDMTLEQILSGPATDRPNGAAHLMTEAEARGILLQVEKQMPRKRRGPAMRNLANHAAHGTGRLSPEAIALYRAYATAYGA